MSFLRKPSGQFRPNVTPPRSTAVGGLTGGGAAGLGAEPDILSREDASDFALSRGKFRLPTLPGGGRPNAITSQLQPGVQRATGSYGPSPSAGSLEGRGGLVGGEAMRQELRDLLAGGQPNGIPRQLAPGMHNATGYSSGGPVQSGMNQYASRPQRGSTGGAAGLHGGMQDLAELFNRLQARNALQLAPQIGGGRAIESRPVVNWGGQPWDEDRSF